MYKSVRNLLIEPSWQDRSFFSSPFSSSAKDRGCFLPPRLPVFVAVPDFVTIFSVKFMCMFCSTCLKGIFHITAFYVWLNVHTKGAREASVAFRGYTDNTACLHRWSKTQRQPKTAERRGTRLHNDALQGAWTCTARLDRKPGKLPGAAQGKVIYKYWQHPPTIHMLIFQSLIQACSVQTADHRVTKEKTL